MFARTTVNIGALAALACLAAALASPADAQRWRGDDGYYPGPQGRPYRGGCLSSNGVNARIMRDGWYPEALVGQRQGGQILLMRVSQGPRRFIATVDGCTGQILHMRGLYRGEE